MAAGGGSGAGGSSCDVVAGSGWPTGAVTDAAAAAAITGADALVSLLSKSCTPAISEPPHDKQNLFEGGLLAPHDGHNPAAATGALTTGSAACSGVGFERLAPHDRQNLLVAGLLAPQDWQVAPLVAATVLACTGFERVSPQDKQNLFPAVFTDPHDENTDSCSPDAGGAPGCGWGTKPPAEPAPPTASDLCGERVPLNARMADAADNTTAAHNPLANCI